MIDQFCLSLICQQKLLNLSSTNRTILELILYRLVRLYLSKNTASSISTTSKHYWKFIDGILIAIHLKQIRRNFILLSIDSTKKLFLRCNIISLLSKTAYLISAVLLIDDRKPSRDKCWLILYIFLTHIRFYVNIRKRVF